MTVTFEALIHAQLLDLDKDVNGYVLGGDEQQTISARAYAVELAGVDSFWRIVIDRLFFDGHCKGAWEREMRARLDQTGAIVASTGAADPESDPNELADRVRLPTGRAEAEAMVRVGLLWLDSRPDDETQWIESLQPGERSAALQSETDKSAKGK